MKESWFSIPSYFRIEMNSTRSRVFNFSAGPAVLPESVLEQVASEMVALPGVGSSILEVSHRGDVFTRYLNSARDGLRDLLAIPPDYEILFLQGGSRLQFAMIPMNFMGHDDRPAAYCVTGSWGKQAYQEAAAQGKVDIVWSGEESGFKNLPTTGFELDRNSCSYFYYVSNETIQGVQFAQEPDVANVPVICDASSDFLHKPLDVSKYDMIYACAQKNAGPAGLTIVVVKKDLIETGNANLPGYLDYRSHAKNGSLFNTPPTFAIYVFSLVVQWLNEAVGGLSAMHELNQQKSKLLYDIIDRFQGFYLGHADKEFRSLMNVVFNFADDQLRSRFLAEAEAAGLVGLAGHRSVGGIRASVYNAMPVAGVEALAEFMTRFAEDHG